MLQVSLYENGLNGILGDEMGLGKTIQCIALLAHLIEKGVAGPFLIVAPLGTLGNWVSELQRFAPSIPVVLYHGSPDDRAMLRAKKMKGGDKRPVVVTSFEIVNNDKKYLKVTTTTTTTTTCSHPPTRAQTRRNIPCFRNISGSTSSWTRARDSRTRIP